MITLAETSRHWITSLLLFNHRRKYRITLDTLADIYCDIKNNSDRLELENKYLFPINDINIKETFEKTISANSGWLQIVEC